MRRLLDALTLSTAIAAPLARASTAGAFNYTGSSYTYPFVNLLQGPEPVYTLYGANRSVACSW
jgi:hypothetical protein